MNVIRQSREKKREREVNIYRLKNLKVVGRIKIPILVGENN